MITNLKETYTSEVVNITLNFLHRFSDFHSVNFKTHCNLRGNVKIKNMRKPKIFLIKEIVVFN